MPPIPLREDKWKCDIVTLEHLGCLSTDGAIVPRPLRLSKYACECACYAGFLCNVEDCECSRHGGLVVVATVTMQELQWETMASMMDCDAHLCGVDWSPKTNKRRSSHLSHTKFTTLGAEEKKQRGTL